MHIINNPRLGTFKLFEGQTGVLNLCLTGDRWIYVQLAVIGSR